jgi:hypothetical protein
MPRKTLARPQDLAEIERRLEMVRHDSVRRWGTLTAGEMLCHLTDALRVSMGERPAEPVRPFMPGLMRLVALSAPVPWMKGIRTRSESDPKAAGTRPADFERDRSVLRDALRRFVQPAARPMAHRVLGGMSEPQWLRWGYLHFDHHLRQFGV